MKEVIPKAGPGGAREGAGRKPGVPNKITRELREAIHVESLVHILEVAATTGRLPVRDIEGNITYREIRPSEQLEALITLLRKVMPDLKSQEITLQEAQTEKVITIDLSRYRDPPPTG